MCGDGAGLSSLMVPEQQLCLPGQGRNGGCTFLLSYIGNTFLLVQADATCLWLCFSKCERGRKKPLLGFFFCSHLIAT